MSESEIERLRYEAKRLRLYAKARRQEIATLKARPLGSRDPVAMLRARDRIGEYTLAAKLLDERIALLRAGARTVPGIVADALAKIDEMRS